MLGFSVRELMSLIAPSSAAKPGLDSELVDLVSWLCPGSSASGRAELEPGTGALAHWLSNIWGRFHCCGTWPHLCSNEQEIMMIYTSWDLPFLHSGQVSPWGWGLGVLHPWGGDPVGLGGPTAQVKLNFSYQYSRIPWLLQDIQTGKWGFTPFTLPLYMTKNPSCKREHHQLRWHCRVTISPPPCHPTQQWPCFQLPQHYGLMLAGHGSCWCVWGQPCKSASFQWLAQSPASVCLRRVWIVLLAPSK